MQANPVVGVLFHWIGGLAAASFYLPYRGVRGWAWETYWIVGGFFAWVVTPFLFCLLLIPDTPQILADAPAGATFWAIFFGVVWGVGGITYGLTMRYLGIGLGVAVALGCCAAAGTLLPPIVSGEIGDIVRTGAGLVVLLGVAMCVAGIVISGLAGMSKEREMSVEQKAASIAEFNFAKGMVVAILCGLTSAAFAYGLAAGKPIGAMAAELLAKQGRTDLWQNLPVLVLVMLGGFATNLVYCVAQNVRNRTGGNYLGDAPPAGVDTAAASVSESSAEGGGDEPEEGSAAVAVAVATERVAAPSVQRPPRRVPLGANYALCAAAGVTWYLQFFFYSMGQTRMGPYDFSSWTMHMASIIIFSTLWGVTLKEWKGTSGRTHALIAAGLVVLIASTIVVGYGNFMRAGVASATE